MRLFLLFASFVLGHLCYSQNIDSLKLALKSTQNDTVKANLLASLAENAPDGEWERFNTELLELCENKLKNTSANKAETYLYKKHLAGAYNNLGYLNNLSGSATNALNNYEKGLKIQQEINDKKGIAISLNNIGVVHLSQGDITKALQYYEKSLKMKEEMGDRNLISTSLNNIGIIYYKQGNIPKALDYYTKSLKLDEETGDKQGMAASLLRIAFVYKDLGDYSKALDYSEKSLKLRLESGNKHGAAQCYNNLGSIYHDMNDFPKAMDYYEKSVQLQKEIGDKYGLAQSLNIIGNIYDTKNDNEKALSYFTQSYKLKEEIGDKEGIVWSMINIGNIHLKKGDLPKALEFANTAMKISQELGFNKTRGESAFMLYQVYNKQGKHKDALNNYKLYIQLRDSIQSKENQKAAIQSQFKYEYGKKAAADSVKVAEEKKVVAAQLQQEKTQRFALYGGLVLVLVFAVFMFNRFRVTQKQKNIIEVKEKETREQNFLIARQKEEVEKQKHLVEEKQKEIVDSINYAKRLQDAILPPQNFIDEYLNNFILYKPKDIVAGDFYWAEKAQDLFFIAAADSTGHGVPGAMVSVVCSNALNRSVKEFGITEPGKILDKTRELVIGTFEKSESEVKDGMDISLLCIDSKNKRVWWSGANNPLWYLSGKELTEIKADKQPIGKSDHPKPFTTHEITWQSGSTFYLFTDGIADQFGGPKGKKLKYKQFSGLILDNSHLPLKQQCREIERYFEDWRGQLEQVDDVCVIGLSI